LTDAAATGARIRPKSDFDEAFHEYIGRRELRLPYLRGSSTALDLNAAPATDMTEIEWRLASGLAELYSFVVYRQQFSEDRAAPYNVAWVSLAEGPMLISTVILEQNSELRISMPLRAEFDDHGLLVFRPAQNP